jgi:hypothetical protein
MKDYFFREMARENASLPEFLTGKAVNARAMRVMAVLEQQPTLTNDQIESDDQYADLRMLLPIDYGIEEQLSLGKPQLKTEVNDELAYRVGWKKVKDFFEMIRMKGE